MHERLAIDGGAPIRDTLLPYGRQVIDEADIEAVVSVLRSVWVTTGPMVEAFERAFAGFVGAEHAVSVSSGTAALHTAMAALGVGPGDEVIVPPITFAATANAVVFQGGTPVFADVDPDTLLLDPAEVERLITPRTRAVVAVDYAGQPCDYAALRQIAARHGAVLVADACHALGAEDRGRRAGTLADLNVFSFHPVKHLTTGEGGMITTSSAEYAERMRRFRNHCITRDHHERTAHGAWRYEITGLGWNYRLTDIQCALGGSQLTKVDGWLQRRREIARRYLAALATIPGAEPLRHRDGVLHAYHLFVIRVDPGCLDAHRDAVFAALRAEGIGVNVHYEPVHLHPLYRERFGTRPGLCPKAEAAAERILSLPMFAGMSDRDVQDVIAALEKVCHALAARVMS